MKINIKATNIDLTQNITDYLEKKLSVLDKFFKDEEVLVNVEIGKESTHHKSGNIFKTEIHLKLLGEEIYIAVDKDDLYATIDEAKDEIVSEITSKRKKAMRMLRKGGQKIKNIIKNFSF